MHWKILSRRGVAAAALLAAAACGDNSNVSGPGSPADAPQGAPADFRAGVEIGSAEVGQLAGVRVVTEGNVPQRLGVMQGTLRFDASKLEYAGLDAEHGAIVVTNTQDAGRGRVRFSALRLPALEREVAVFAFRVKAPGYASAIRFELEEAATADEKVFNSAESFARQAAVRAPASPASPSWRDWVAKLEQAEIAGLRENRSTGIAKFAGQGTIYGDVNLSGSITGGDAVYAQNVSVGNFGLPDSLPTRDAALAGNVRPINDADGTLVGFNDPCPLGVVCSAAPFATTGPGSITGADVQQIAQASASIGGGQAPPAGLNVTIPRGSFTSGDTTFIAGGTYTAATCPDGCNWTRNRIYVLEGIVRLSGNAVLNIQEGARVEGRTRPDAASTLTSALFIDRDAQIFARGSLPAPIVFTCTQSGLAAAARFKGCWGGIAIVGSAPINFGGPNLPAAPTIAGRNPAGGGLQRLLEGTGGAPAGGGAVIDTLLFGGSNPDDNSGVIRYARIEYAGRVLTALGSNNELNGITAGGVGRGTTFEYIQIHAGLDDGFEFFGGTANVRYLYLTANSDDQFDWAFGWQGSAQFMIAQMDSLDGEKGFEGDNNEGSGCTTPGCTGSTATFNETPRTNGPIYNVTWIGKLNPTNPGIPVAGNGVNDAIHIRRGNRSQIANGIFVGFRAMLDLDDAATCSNASDDPEVRNSAFGGFAALGNTDGSDPACFRGATEADVINNAALNNISDATFAYASQMGRPFDVLAPDFRPRDGSTLAGRTPAAPPAGNSFIQATTYIGAVAPAAVTPNNLAWYMGWTRGWTTASQP